VRGLNNISKVMGLIKNKDLTPNCVKIAKANSVTAQEEVQGKMVSSIEFVRPADLALPELKTLCMRVGVAFTREEKVNKGVKLHGTVENQPIAILLYYSQKKRISSKIVFEKMPEDRKALLIKSLSLTKSSGSKAIPIHASIIVADKNTRMAIKDSLISTYPTLTQCPTQSHMDYLVKILSKGNDLTVTQFSSGSLLLQGGYSDLVDRVVDIIDRIKPLSTEERALLFVPEDSKAIVQEKINKGTDVFERALATVESTRQEYFGFLFRNDQKSLVTGDALTEILENQSKILPEYNFLVAIYARVFEGFIIKLLIEKEFFTLAQYASDPDIADIGNALRKRKFEKYIKDKRRFGYVIEQLISVWEGCRCKEMHSDPAAEPGIISFETLESAKNRIGEVKSCIKDAYHVLVKHGLTDRDLAPKVPGVEPQSIAHSVDMPRLAQNGYIGTDESGKGDYFGPLVVAGVFLDQASEKRLADAGIRDSKKISDNRIREFAKMIRSYLDKAKYSVVVIGPEKYNELYAKIGNLNRLLAWGHARSIENILMAVDCSRAIADQFGDESYIKQALLEKGKGIELLQMPKAEQHVAVAAASVLAREGFLLRLAELNKEFGMEFPKGASIEVENAAKHFVEKYGMNQLAKCAKLHFKTTEKLRK
jgi:ribonuclease HIII